MDRMRAIRYHSKLMLVLGIDPGLSRCGYGAVVHARRPCAVAAGVITTDTSLDRAIRLAELQAEIRSLIGELQPDTVAVERLLFKRNVSTAMTVSQAAGVVMAEAATAGCSVAEYSPNEVKQAVAGYGRADKHEVTAMVQRLLGLTHRLYPADAADAVAVALCHIARTPGTAPMGAVATPAGSAGVSEVLHPVFADDGVLENV